VGANNAVVCLFLFKSISPLIIHLIAVTDL